jgi:hypothetical protein
LEGFVEDGGTLYSEPGGKQMMVDEVFGDSPEAVIVDGSLTPEQRERVAELTADELTMIDEAILRNCSDQFRKIARVVGSAMIENQEAIPHVPDIFYADRVRRFVVTGKLESKGRIDAMRFGEVKLPD